MTWARTADPTSFLYGRLCFFNACSSASRPFRSVSSRVSRENHWRILLRARGEAADGVQCRAGRPLGIAFPTLVQPVRRDAELGDLVHVPGSHLDLERPALRADYGRV